MEAEWAKFREEVANQKRRVKKRERKFSSIAGPVTQKRASRLILKFYQSEVLGLIEAERPFEGEWAVKKPIHFEERAWDLVFSEAPPLFKPEPANPVLLSVRTKSTKTSETVDLLKSWE